MIFFDAEPMKRIQLKRMLCCQMKRVFLKPCCRAGSDFGSASSVAIDLFFISKCDVIYSQALSAGAKRALSVSAVVIPLQEEININYIVADHTVPFNDDTIIGAKPVIELWFSLY